MPPMVVAKAPYHRVECPDVFLDTQGIEPTDDPPDLFLNTFHCFVQRSQHTVLFQQRGMLAHRFYSKVRA
jgi:hypothetical protein